MLTTKTLLPGRSQWIHVQFVFVNQSPFASPSQIKHVIDSRSLFLESIQPATFAHILTVRVHLVPIDSMTGPLYSPSM